ncbi:spore germination protein, partial [Sulfobacillus harzensis]
HRLATPHLVFEQLSLGTRYPVAVAMAYLRDVVNPEVRQAVSDRLTRIRTDTVVNATMVASYLRDHPGTIMPTVRNSERVDLVVWQLIQGKVAVLVDGDPFVLWVPTTLCDFYRTSEDYTTPWYNATFIRGIRWIAWGFGLYLPAVYIALTEVNPDLVPPPLVILTAGSHTGLPFTPIVEVLVMVLIIEILREAALRLPKPLATTIGTVGAIVVGTAVVKAGFV